MIVQTGLNRYPTNLEAVKIERDISQMPAVSQKPINADTLSISKEGIKSYKDSVMSSAKEALGNSDVILTDFRTELTGKLPSTYGEKKSTGEYERIYYSVSEQKNNLSKVYSELRDEIEKGYTDGTGEIYVSDNGTEKGYRKLSKEEALSELERTYEEQSELIDSVNDPKIVNSLNAHAEKVNKLSGGNAKVANEYLKARNAVSSGTLRAISDEEAKAIKEQQKSEPKTLSVDGSEIIDNIYSKTGDNITYDVNGVTFTNAEMKSCKEVVKNALSLLPTKDSDLNYNTYASMGIAANMVNTYASKNLTSEQAKVVNDSFNSYLNDMMKAEKDRHAEAGYKTDSSAQYYAVKTQSGTVQSASDKLTAENIMNLFKNAKLNNKQSVNNVFSQYRQIMTPAYLSYGLRNTVYNNSLTNVINGDIDRLNSQINSIKNFE